MKSLNYTLLSLLLSSLSATKLTQFLQDKISKSNDTNQFYDILVQLTPVEFHSYKCHSGGDYEKVANAKAKWVLKTVQNHSNSTSELILPTIHKLQTEKHILNSEKFFLTNTLSLQADAQAIKELDQLAVVKEISSDAVIKSYLDLSAYNAGGYAIDVNNGNSSDCNSKLQRRDDVYYDNWHVLKIGVTKKVRNFIANKTPLVIGFPDTGVNYQHEAVSENYRGNVGNGNIEHDYNWFDAITDNDPLYPNKICPPNSPAPCDDNGHGTMVSSLAISTDIIGVNPNSKWIACRNMNQGFSTLSAYLRCLEFMFAPTRRDGTNPNVELRPHVVNHSYGCQEDEGCSPTSFNRAIASLKEAGIISVKSSGNSGEKGCSSMTTQPVSAPHIYNVGGLAYNSNSRFSSSSVGPIAGRGVSTNLMAPGNRITVAEYSENGMYGVYDGTSLSAPQVGAAALIVMQACPHYLRRVDMVMQLLEYTATPLYSSMGCGGDNSSTRPNNEYGYGLINVEKAVKTCLAEINQRL
ncbi:subtilisin-like protein [Conidiobolus coronatus NRRL 28638]|uniref:Subtilisin-like protein n=1 Tax=Conidiobolus coronatus (strain ATCC 28846 / CBS 209.66 / NRRL 28638) TaxID=796925 RepID=A0A137PAW1_CONC2|nr:subtilisin-like protein [Conidiobolus coronatus NRRL 28638]|eukprot:KXN72061.1 subtilisin-like protein [Conidiobolus coronatus NRRL 28638]